MSRQNDTKRLIRFITQNVRGLKNDVKIHELITSLKERQVFAGCILETWRTGISNLELNGFHLLNSGLPNDTVKSRRGEQGASIVLSPEAHNSWRAAGCELHNDLHWAPIRKSFRYPFQSIYGSKSPNTFVDPFSKENLYHMG